MEHAASKPDILLVSTADWDNPYWTNKQHVAAELARRGHRILYIESQGLRRPTATTRDLGRIYRRLRRGLRRPRQVRENIWVLAPVVIPLQSSGLVRRLNRFLLDLSIGLWTRVLGLRPEIFWTYSPLTTELYDISKHSLVVYHAVDDIKAQPGMPREVIEQAEAELSRRANIIFATAPHLAETHRKANPNTHFLPNVADFQHFQTALLPDTAVPADIAAIAQPRIGFIGAISGYKLDFELLRRVAVAKPDWSIVLVGEVGEGDPWTKIDVLSSLPNVHLLGGRSYASLPGYLKAMDVAILPNLINEYTRSMFPMKFFEYLAAGRQIVGTSLPALADYGEIASFIDGPDAWVSAIESILAGNGPSLEHRTSVAQEYTYEARTAKMMDLVVSHAGGVKA